MSSRLLTYDPIRKMKTEYHFDRVTNEVVIANEQDVEDILETNKRLYNMVDERAKYGAWGDHVAAIPMEIYLRWEREGVFEDERELKRRLNDPDNRFLRTRPGRI